MKRASIALAGLMSRIAAAVGIEGAFLLVGTTLLAVGSTYIVPFGPYLVVGGMAVLAGIALALPAGRR